jgi:TP901 family phage tail tape measure protein
MPKKALASLNVVINAVTKPLFRGLNRASKRVAAFGSKMKTVGRSISTSFTLPFAAVGIAGAKLAVDFEQSMTKITTLVGTSAEEVNKLGASVKAMAVETATPAKELADALFFIQSAGIKGAESLEVLEVSAKAAAMNMGDITDIASATTSIMEAFGVSSGQAGDLLHETLKQGKFEASEFMNKIGAVIPTAAGLGVSFEELGAATATMSKISGDAAGSLTAINQVMMQLATPGAEQKAILAELNMSYDDLNSMMQDSLMGTLNHLFTELEGNDEMLTRVFGSSRAVRGAFATAGLQAETYADVLDGMNNSMGNVNKGFETQSETVGFKMKQSFEKLKEAASELGVIMIPLMTKIAEFASKMAKGFVELDNSTKTLIVATATLIALSGPLATLGGGLIALFSFLLTPIGAVVVGIGALFYVIISNWGTVKKYLAEFINYFIDLYNESMLFRGAVNLVIAVFKNLWAEAKFVFNNMRDVLGNMIDSFVGQFKGLAKIIAGAFKGSLSEVKAGVKQYAKAAGDGLKDSVNDVAKNAKILGEEIAKNTAEAIENTLSREKIEFVTEEDIQNNVDNIGKFFTDKLTKIKDKLTGFFGSGPTLLVPEGGEGGEDPEGGGDDSKTLQKTIEKKKSILQKYLDFAKTGYGKFADKVAEVWQGIEQVAGSVLNSIGNLFAAQSNKALTILENEETKKNQSLENDFLREEAAIMNSGVSQAKKDAMLIQLKEKFDGKQATLDKDMDAKKKALQKKAATREKKMQIASAIMATAAAVVQALKAGPFIGPPLAILMGGLGAAQIATIASTPIPLATGGLAFGPTNAIVGDNPNAKNDPEVIAPLSKLKSMLGIQNINVNIDGAIKGEDIFLSNQLAGNTRNRFI